MNLGDLLSELRENILHDRSDRVSGSNDFLWSDETLVRYINEAQRRFARKSLVIRDSTSPDATFITMQNGVDTYQCHQSVIAVMSMRLASKPVDLVRVGHSILNGYRPPDNLWFDPTTTILPPGPPVAYSCDESVGPDENDSAGVVTIRLYPTPDASMDQQQLRLRVVRTPFDKFTVSNTTQVPEIPEDHHLDMLDWAAYLALRIVDHDAGDTQRAIEFRQSFDAACDEARKTALRKMFTPQPWGFGRNGFSWES